MNGAALRARFIGSTASGILRASAHGAVAATFAHSCYLELDAGIIALVAPDLLNGPLNVVVTAPAAFSFEEVPGGHVVQATPAAITIGDGLRVEMAGAPVWPAQLLPLTGVDARRAAARVAAIESILTEAPAEGLARAEWRPSRAADAMSALAEGIRRSEAGMVERAASRLAGLGPGLTPSGDDVLAGVMIALTLAPAGGPSDLCRAIYRGAAGRTTRLSAAYLEAASRGEAGEAWHLLREAMSSPSDDVPCAVALDAAARRVLTFGETSGADMLAGFVLGLDALSLR